MTKEHYEEVVAEKKTALLLLQDGKHSWVEVSALNPCYVFYEWICDICGKRNVNLPDGQYEDCDCMYRKLVGDGDYILRSHLVGHEPDYEIMDRLIDGIPEDCQDEVLIDNSDADDIPSEVARCRHVGLLGPDICGSCPFIYAEGYRYPQWIIRRLR